MLLIKRLRSGWTSLKVLRVLLGVLILYSAAAEGITGGILFGSFFTLLALFTDGTCCAGGTCSRPGSKP